jgi:Matrixin/Carboxypeptidase regulatory-like domain
MKTVIAALAALAIAAPLLASSRLTYELMGQPTAITWPAAAMPIAYTIDQKVVDRFPGAKGEIDAAFAEWAAVPNTSLRFRSGGVAAGARAGEDKTNLVTLAADMFGNSNYLAFTTNWYDDRTGTILEADIQIDPSIAANGYDLQQVVEHEVGHFIGLDHSAVVSSILFPYIPPRGKAVLASDDRVAVATVYPSPAMTGVATLRGSVVGDSGGIFGAQVVALNTIGEPVATALTDSSGNFELTSLPTGDYRIYAEPLDGPVTSSNLAGVYSAAHCAPFHTKFMTDSIKVENGRMYGNLVVNSGGGTTTLNPKFVGVMAPNSYDVSLGFAPANVKAGSIVTVAVGGDGFTSGMTTFEVLSPSFRRVSDFKYSANFLTATFQIAADARSGSAVILVHSGNDSAALTGGLRIEGTSSSSIGPIVAPPGKTRAARK